MTARLLLLALAVTVLLVVAYLIDLGHRGELVGEAGPTAPEPWEMVVGPPTTTTTTLPPTTTTSARARTAPIVHAASASRPAPVGDVWHALAMCETGGTMNQRATSRTGRYLGYFQFSLETWRSVGGTGDPRDFDYETQRSFAARLQARSGWGQWPHCSRVLGLR